VASGTIVASRAEDDEMTFSKELETAFSEQTTREFASAYGYLAKAAWCEEHNLPGMAHWMQVQYAEENGHAMRFYRFLVDRGARVGLREIPEPRAEFASVVEVFADALEGERKLTAAIEELYTRAADDHDYASFPILQWFVEEQVEEERMVETVLAQLEMAGDNPSALLLLDRELAGRPRVDG
jgi:ferritin